MDLALLRQSFGSSDHSDSSWDEPADDFRSPTTASAK